MKGFLLLPRGVSVAEHRLLKRECCKHGKKHFADGETCHFHFPTLSLTHNHTYTRTHTQAVLDKHWDLFLNGFGKPLSQWCRGCLEIYLFLLPPRGADAFLFSSRLLCISGSTYVSPVMLCEWSPFAATGNVTHLWDEGGGAPSSVSHLSVSMTQTAPKLTWFRFRATAVQRVADMNI